MVASIVASMSVPLPSYGFTQVPNSVLLNTSLSKNARFLYSILMQHGRASSNYSVFPSYARICLLMGVSEPTARRAMNELRLAGLVMQDRRGQGRSNRYQLQVRPKESFVQEQKAGGVKEDEKEEHQEGNIDFSIPKPPISLSLDKEENPAEPQTTSHSPVPARVMDEARIAIFPFVKDIAREMHDESSLVATTTRAVRIFHRSGVSIDRFQDHLLAARQITQERSSSIKKARVDGVKAKVPYFFAVLEKSLGLDGAQTSQSGDWSYPRSQSRTAYSSACQVIENDLGVRGMHHQRK